MNAILELRYWCDVPSAFFTDVHTQSKDVGAQTNVLERRLFFIPSFKIYGSVAGFYDFGPPGCAIKQNVTQLWRQHFILEESMLEVGVTSSCPCLT
jgi:glycyl-tRNA synthetase